LKDVRKQAPRRDTTPKTLKWHGKVAAWIISMAGRGIGSSLRVSVVNSEEVLGPLAARPVVYALWHNRLAGISALVPALDHKRKTAGVAALISASKDGALLARTVQYFGIQPVRGSSSRRGAQALLELSTWIGKGYDAAITPDGPRGPKYHVREGAVALAQATGAPLVPVGVNFGRKWELKSWDAFQIPVLFTTCEICLGPALEVPSGLNEADRQTWRARLESELKAANRVTD
jgi:lysophospholipid acyltransferase (LPLAT)-like uncharacterized protein